VTLISLTSLWINGRALVPPKLNSKRASFVLSKIDEDLGLGEKLRPGIEILNSWNCRYLCEVRAGQYWRLENVKSFDEYLERFPVSRRKAYYLMTIHEHLPRVPKSDN
jgi:hypothetical protein